MIGAIIGDIAGSRYEFTGYKERNFDFFDPRNRITDDSLMTFAVAKTLMTCKEWHNEELLKQTAIACMKEIAAPRRGAGWGFSFYKWLYMPNRSIPYNSFGNGAGMRISPVGWVAKSEEEVKYLSRVLTEISHNHPEGIKGAEAIAMSVYMARVGKTKEEIRARIEKDYYPEIKDMTVEGIYPTYGLDEKTNYVSCQSSIPQTLVCFLDGKDFEEVIRYAVSLGGDADTMACMAGGIAEAYFGVPKEFEEKTLMYLSEDLKEIYFAFRNFKCEGQVRDEL